VIERQLFCIVEEAEDLDASLVISDSCRDEAAIFSILSTTFRTTPWLSSAMSRA
jgi:hypothetical protein